MSDEDRLQDMRDNPLIFIDEVLESPMSPWQREAITALMESNRQVVFVTGRRSGKSALARAYFKYLAATKPLHPYDCRSFWPKVRILPERPDPRYLGWDLSASSRPDRSRRA